MISPKIRYQRFGFLLVLIVLPGLIYYFRYIRNNIVQTEYVPITNDFSNITHSNFQLEKQEVEYLRQFNHLFWLRDIVPNKFVFGTYDNSEKVVVPHKKIIIYRMINSSNGDYVRFVGHEGLRAAYGLHAIKKHIFAREIWIPVSKTEFHWKWKQGRFLECIRLNISNNGQNSPVIPDSYVDNMAVFRDFLEYYRATPFLFSGTLLGWYRECSFIKDTTDVDMAMRITSLDPVMLKHMEKSSDFKLHWILGKVNDSLEVSIYSGKIKIDLFFLYENKGSAWVGGMMVNERRKLRWFYPPIIQICTGDLLGRLFHVPCNVEEILKAEYGNWRVPHPTANFIWYKSHKNIHEAGYWSKNEWNDVYKKF